MKNIGIIIAAIIILLIVAVGGVFFLKYSKAPAMPPAQSTNAQPTKTVSNTATDSILNLISSGKTVNCQITYPDNKGTGTMFVSDKKFAGDFTMKAADGKETTGHIISDGTFMYIWSANMPTGIKVNLAAAKNLTQNSAVSRSFDVNQKVGLNCSPWIADNSKFTLPTNVKFQDMSQLLQQVQPQTTTVPTTETGTSPCDQVPAGAARTACLNAIQSSGQ